MTDSKGHVKDVLVIGFVMLAAAQKPEMHTMEESFSASKENDLDFFLQWHR